MSIHQIVYHARYLRDTRGSIEYDSRSQAFSLVELITVIAIIGVIATLIAPAASQFLVGSKFDQALVQVSGSLERAREHASANGTYTYVGFTDVDAAGTMAVATFGSADTSAGIKGLTQQGNYVLSAAPSKKGGLSLLDRIVRVEGCDAQDAIPDGSALKSLQAVTAPSSSLRPSGPEFTYVDGARGNLRFTRVVQFTPEGAARVVPAVSNALQLVLVPTRGDPQSPHQDVANAAAIRIAGLTGQVKVYRP